MNLFDELQYRGLIKDYSNAENIKEMLKTPQTIYCGFDPSAASMHMGNFVMIATLMRLQKAGHKIIAVVGGATGMIGDPSGRSSERNLLDKKALAHNTEQIGNQLRKYLDFTDPKKGLIVNNYDWLSKLDVLEFLRRYGKYFTVNYMLAKDTVARRLETGISFAEFSYMILQAVDFLHLYEHYGCTIQIGGSDQWGNLVSGLDLIRKVKGPDTKVEVMTSHLLTNCAGEKFGKSLDGALFLDPKKFSPYKLYQYFINVGDDDAEKYLKVFTFLSKEMIEDIVSKHKEAPHNRLAQTRLAEEILTIVHNKEALKHAQNMSSALFSGHVKDLSAADIEDLFSHALVKVAANQKLEDVVIAVKAASSKREAREFIRGNSISVNGERYTDPELIVNQDYLLHHKYLIIRRGKKKYFVAEVK
ncbi:MAG: Tyrosine--tRNA ligase [Tenericutes bacterium ADurb.Bin239]|nr:MAG: Tyrosine--tRNA ligase [Tenericutes bacterium ADurb.Bin239]